MKKEFEYNRRIRVEIVEVNMENKKKTIRDISFDIQHLHNTWAWTRRPEITSQL